VDRSLDVRGELRRVVFRIEDTVVACWLQSLAAPAQPNVGAHTVDLSAAPDRLATARWQAGRAGRVRVCPKALDLACRHRIPVGGRDEAPLTAPRAVRRHAAGKSRRSAA
jgi:hypothetical protein